MVQPINKNMDILKKKAEPATKDDIGLAKDLLDTLASHRHHCVGMAANMIGVPKAIIVVALDAEMDIKGLLPAGYMSQLQVMLNPRITKKSPRIYEDEEGCLSLEGARKTKRYEWVEVSFRDMSWRKQSLKLTGFTAQAVQHEMDHLKGIIV